MKDTYYLKHDINASQDDSVSWMRSEYGAEGYGLYWLINEYLRNQSACIASVERIDVIAFSIHVEPEKLKGFINDCINKYNLYENDEKYFWSSRLLDDKKHLDNIREKNSENARKRWEKKAPVMRSHSERCTVAMQGEVRKGEVRKEEVRKEKKEEVNKEERERTPGNNKKFSKPKREEFDKYCKEINFSCEYGAFYDYYEAKGWMIGTNKMKNWKSALRNWQRRDKKKPENTNKITNMEFWG